jgi:hypothetical protein
MSFYSKGLIVGNFFSYLVVALLSQITSVDWCQTVSPLNQLTLRITKILGISAHLSLF